MNYQKEYAILVGQVDRAISLLEQCALDEPLARKAGELLLAALREAEEHYVGLVESVCTCLHTFLLKKKSIKRNLLCGAGALRGGFSFYSVRAGPLR